MADYEKAIQTAFREVADDLAAKKFLDEQLADQTALVKAEQRRYELSDARYRNGVDSYLTVLTAQQDLYSAQQNLITTQFSRLSNLINLYQSLGGGWRENTAQPGTDQISNEKTNRKGRAAARLGRPAGRPYRQFL